MSMAENFGQMQTLKEIRHHQRQIDFHTKQLKRLLAELPPGEVAWHKSKEAIQ